MVRSLLSFLVLLSFGRCVAGHLPGGNITYTCTGPDEYAVTLTLFRDCSGTALLPQALTFTSTCGLTYTLNALPVSGGTEVSQLCPADLPNSSCSGGPLPGIEVYSVAASAFMNACDTWTISWEECCRTTSLNVDGNPGTYIEAVLNSATAPCNNSPVFTQDVIPYVCVNQPVSYNLGVTEPDGHALRYKLEWARLENDVLVNYEPGYTADEPFPGMTIDSLTGQIDFTPTLLGNIVVVVGVTEYNTNGDLIGYVMRDFNFVVVNCPNNPPDPMSGVMSNISGGTSVDTNVVEMCRNSTLCFDAEIVDADASQSIWVSSNVASVLPEALLTVGGINPVTVTVCFTPDSTTAGTYGFVITAEDDGCPNTALTTYAYTVIVLPDSTPGCGSTNVHGTAYIGASLSPDPSDGSLRIAGLVTSPSSIEVTDLAGRVRWRIDRPASTGTLDLELPRTLGNGRYVLTVRDRTGAAQRLPFTLLR